MTNTQILDRYKSAIAWLMCFAGTRGVNEFVEHLSGDSRESGWAVLVIGSWLAVVVVGVCATVALVRASRSPAVVDVVPSAAAAGISETVTALRAGAVAALKVASELSATHDQR